VLQRARKVVLSDWEDEWLEDIDEMFIIMAQKDIVNVVSAGDSSTNLDSTWLSPMSTTDPDIGMSSLHPSVIHHEGLSCCKRVR
jgi:hypothetical protein